MRPGLWLLLGVIILPVCAKPYSGRVKIAEETLRQAKDAGIDYGAMLDKAIDGTAANLSDFIALHHNLDAAGAYFHFFHVYEAAELAGDKKFADAVLRQEPRELDLLLKGLAEARGWLRRKKAFAVAFPESTSAFRKSGKSVGF